METLSSMAAAVIIAAIALAGLLRKTDVFSAVVEGAAEGLRTVLRIFPPLVALLTAVFMLRASGAIEALEGLASGLLSLFGIPPETTVLMLLRPLSGSGALAVGADLISGYGVDSVVGRTAAVMLGSTETTFYVLTVLHRAVGKKKTRWPFPRDRADLAGFLMAAHTVKWFWIAE
jgi:spore maturation protein B